MYYIYYLFLLNKPSKSIRQGNVSYNFHTNYFYSLDPFILNLPQAGRQKYIHCTIDLELIKEISLEDFTKINEKLGNKLIKELYFRDFIIS
ncbi:hypothetical protein cco8_05098 [Campylobacter coli 151-9]|nr:hypothetical protein cco8_05098 [Campylobacter coli 151-9]